VLQQASGAEKRAGGETEKQMGAYSHHLAWFYSQDFDPELLEPMTLDGVIHAIHISHLCHDPRCCNPLHLVREPAWVNILRKTCMARHVDECKCLSFLSPDVASRTRPCVFRTDPTDPALLAFIAPEEKPETTRTPKTKTPKTETPKAKNQKHE